MQSFLQDLRYALRMLRKTPGYTFIAVAALALGIGANTAIFSVVNAVLLRPVPFPNANQLVFIWETWGEHGQGTASIPNLIDWREQSSAFSYIAAYGNPPLSLQGKNGAERLISVSTSPGLFQMFGMHPIIGHLLPESSEKSGNGHVVVLSRSFWKSHFDSDPSLPGKTIQLNGQAYEVAGVIDDLPEGVLQSGEPIQLFVPQSLLEKPERGYHYLRVIARIKDGVSLQMAQSQMDAIAVRLAKQYPGNQEGRGVKLIPLRDQMSGQLRTPLLILMAAVICVLLICCANVANLTLARASDRQRETAVRTALGASRYRIVRQQLTESLLTAFAGGGFGLLLAVWLTPALVKMSGHYLPMPDEINIDRPVLLFTFIASLATGILFGLLPALRASGADVQEILKKAGRGISLDRSHTRGVLIAAETALAVMLLISAGLLLKSFVTLRAQHTGINPNNIVSARIRLDADRYADQGKRTAFYNRVIGRLQNMPEVAKAAGVTLLPIDAWGMNGDFAIVGRAPFKPGQAPLAEERAVTPDYYSTMQIPLVRGRFFNASDTAASAPVVIINQALARKLWKNGEALGAQLQPFGPKPVTIVGIVADVLQAGLDQPAQYEIDAPYAQAVSFMNDQMAVVVRSEAPVAAVVSDIRRAVAEADPLQPVTHAMSMNDVIAETISGPRLDVALLGLFAILATIVGAIGIYGVLSYSVRQRSGEIGVRMALGSSRTGVLQLILGQTARLTLIGLAAGLLGAFLFGRVLSSLVANVSTHDPLVFVVVPLFLLFVALLAAAAPAFRASRVDPMVALRYE